MRALNTNSEVPKKMTQEIPAADSELKQKLLNAADGELTSEKLVEVVNAFLNSQVYLPSLEKAAEDGSVSPLFLQDTEEKPVLPLFTNPEEIPEQFTEAAPHVSVVTGAAVIQSVQDVTVVIDPTSEHQFPLAPEQTASIREQIMTQLSDDES